MQIRAGDTFKINLITDARVTAVSGDEITYRLSSARKPRSTSRDNFLKLVSVDGN